MSRGPRAGGALPPGRVAGGGAAALLLWAGAAWAGVTQRFPLPEFEGGYRAPLEQLGPPRGLLPPWVDLAALLLALALASFFVHRAGGSRRRLMWLSLASLAYFGFYREGCICPIGAIQNVSLALATPGYRLPFLAVGFFLAPLIFALFFGKTFCGGVCPLGAIQDLLVLRPVRVPPWLDEGLRTLPYVYLGLAVLLAGTGSAFIICEYDPFVSFFRLAGDLDILLLGGALLALGIFVGRPYCRYLCPYGALLGVAALAARHVVRFSDRPCVQCHRCVAACPFGAARPLQAGARPGGLAGAAWLWGPLLLLPLAVGGGYVLGGQSADYLSRAHPAVQRAMAVARAAGPRGERATDEALALEAAARPPVAYYEDAAAVRQRYRQGASWLAALLALALVVRLWALGRVRLGQEPGPMLSVCFACGRCLGHCPRTSGPEPPAGEEVAASGGPP